MVAGSSLQVFLSKVGLQISNHRQMIVVETARYPKSEHKEAPSGSNMGTPLASVSEYYCFVKKMRLLAATLEDPIFCVHPVFELLFRSKMDGSQLRPAMTLSVEGNRDWGRCVVPMDNDKLQGSSILHLVAGQCPKSGHEPVAYERWLDMICHEVFSQTIVRGLSAASCTM